MSKLKKASVEQADGHSGTAYHRYLKKHKNRIERRKANADPESPPAYGKYKGYET